jgi:hypothetical protein
MPLTLLTESWGVVWGWLGQGWGEIHRVTPQPDVSSISPSGEWRRSRHTEPHGGDISLEPDKAI